MTDALTEKVAKAMFPTYDRNSVKAQQAAQELANAAIVAVLRWQRGMPDDPFGADVVEAMRLAHGPDSRPDAWDYEEWISAFSAGIDSLLARYEGGQK